MLAVLRPCLAFGALICAFCGPEPVERLQSHVRTMSNRRSLRSDQRPPQEPGAGGVFGASICLDPRGVCFLVSAPSLCYFRTCVASYGWFEGDLFIATGNIVHFFRGAETQMEAN